MSKIIIVEILKKRLIKSLEAQIKKLVLRKSLNGNKLLLKEKSNNYNKKLIP